LIGLGIVKTKLEISLSALGSSRDGLQIQFTKFPTDAVHLVDDLVPVLPDLRNVGILSRLDRDD